MGARQISVRDGASLAKVRATSVADSSFAALIPTTTKPATDGVINLRRFGTIPQWLFLMPYVLGSDDDVFDMWVTGWRKIGTLWVPTRLVKLTCTAGTCVGVAGAPVINTERFCDTITASMGISNVSYQLFSPADNTPAHALVSPDGCELVQFTFDNTTGTGTTNCLWSRM